MIPFYPPHRVKKWYPKIDGFKKINISFIEIFPHPIPTPEYLQYIMKKRMNVPF